MEKQGKEQKIPETGGRVLNHVAGIYDWLSPVMTFGQERIFSARAIDLLGLKPQDRVLDLGCGTGRVAIDIAKKIGSQVVGMDAAPRMIEICRRKAKDLNNIKFDVEVAESLPYPDNYFDAAVSTFFYHHINYELKIKSLKEARRVLKGAGRLVIVDVDMPVNLFGRLCAWAGYFLFRQEEIKENIQGKLRAAIDQSGFSKWEHYGIYQGYISIFILTK